MHALALRTATGLPLTVRVLQHGDTGTVAALFDRLGEHSRSLRFGGAKVALTAAELAALATADGEHHVLVAYVDNDRGPAGIVRLVRDPEDRRIADVACAVADEHQRHGIGRTLIELLAADARAAGITRLRATASADNCAAAKLVRNVGRIVEQHWAAGQVELTASLAA